MFLMLAFHAACISRIAVAAPADSFVQIQLGHFGGVNEAAFSPDGRQLASTGDDGLRLWDVSSARLLRAFADGTGPVAFNRAGTLLAVGGSVSSPTGKRSHGVLVLDASTLDFRRIFPVEERLIAVSFAANDEHVVAAEKTGKVRVWSISTGTNVRKIASEHIGHGGAPQYLLQDLAVASDGRTAVGVYRGDGVIVWDLSNGRVLHRLATLDDRQLTDVTISPDGAVAAASGWNGLHFIDLATGRLRRTLGKHPEGSVPQSGSACFSPDGAWVAAEQGFDIVFWDARTLQPGPAITKTPHSRKPTAVLFAPGGEHLLTASGVDDRPAMVLWGARTREMEKSFDGPGTMVKRIDIRPEGTEAVIAFERGKPGMVLWDIAAGRLVRIIDHTATTVPEAILFTGKEDEVLFVDVYADFWDARHGKELRRWPKVDDPMSGAVDPNRRWMAVGYWGGAMVCDVHTGQQCWQVDRGDKTEAFYQHVALTPDGRLLTGDSGHLPIALWDRANPKTPRMLRLPLLRDKNDTTDPNGNVNALAVSTDGTLALSGGAFFHGLRLWDLRRARLLRTLPFSGHSVNATAFSPDGKLAFVAGSLGEAELFDVAKGTLLRRFVGHFSAVNAGVFTPDGRRMLTGGDDGTIRLWDVASGELLYSALVTSEGDYITWAPSGHFVASPGGLQAGVHVVQGRDIFGIDQIFSRFHDPEYLRRRVAGAKEASATPKTLTLPPKVSFLAPLSDGEVSDASTKVALEVTDEGGGAAKVALYHNDKLLRVEGRGLNVIGRRFEMSIDLLPGLNVLRAVASNNAGIQSEPAIRRVTLAAPLAKSALYLLAVGVDRYRNEAYRLSSAVKDASTVVEALRRGAAALTVKVEDIVLTDAGVTRQSIEEAFARIAGQAEPSDVFVFYFAGHGVMGTRQDGSAEFYLVPHDVIKLYGADDALRMQAISSEELQELSRRVRARKQLLVLDACNAGGALESFAARGAAQERALFQLARSAGVVVLAASDMSQFASEVEALGHGLFTYALLQGLTGSADGGKSADGKITVKELEAYLNDRVPELTREYKGSTQYPQSWAIGQDFPLVLVVDPSPE